jgi:hypothetical protein
MQNNHDLIQDNLNNLVLAVEKNDGRETISMGWQDMYPEKMMEQTVCDIFSHVRKNTSYSLCFSIRPFITATNPDKLSDKNKYCLSHNYQANQNKKEQIDFYKNILLYSYTLIVAHDQYANYNTSNVLQMIAEGLPIELCDAVINSACKENTNLCAPLSYLLLQSKQKTLLTFGFFRETSANHNLYIPKEIINTTEKFLTCPKQ